MPLSAPPYVPHLATAKRYFCDPNGSSNYDGLSSRFPKATIAGVMTLAAASNQGDVYFGPASFPVADTITSPMSVRLHGTSWQNAAGFGTEFVLTGFPDDGRPVILTSTNSTADWTKGLIEEIRITGPGTMTGGGNGINLRNPQNGAVMRNVQVAGMNSGIGVYVYTTTQNANFPAYMLLENVWSTQNKRGFRMEAGTCVTTLLNCAADCTTVSDFEGAVLIENSDYQSATDKAITVATSSGYTATFTVTGHGVAAGNMIEIRGVTPVAYNILSRVETAPDANTITVLMPTANIAAGSAFGVMRHKNGGDRGEFLLKGLKSEISFDVQNFEFRTNARVILDGCSSRLASTGTKAAFSYTGPRYVEPNASVLYPYPPVELRKCQSANHPIAFDAPQFGISEPAITTGGRTTMVDWPKPNVVPPAHAAKPTAAVREFFPRLGVAMTAQAMLSTGRLNTQAVELKAGDIITTMTFMSHTTAAVTPTNQWAVVMNGSRLVVAKSADKTTEAWGAPATKTFTIATDKDDNAIAFYRVPADGLYYVGICVVAATVPSLAGVTGLQIVTDPDPNLSANADTGLTTPASCPDTPSAGTAVGAQFYGYFG